MASAYVCLTNRNGTIKCVSVDSSGEIDELGVQLLEYFNDFTYVKELIKTSIDYVCDGDVTYMDDPDEVLEEEYEYEEYSDIEDLKNSMNCAYYYLFQKDEWLVCKPNLDEFKNLETVIEEEF